MKFESLEYFENSIESIDRINRAIAEAFVIKIIRIDKILHE